MATRFYLSTSDNGVQLTPSTWSAGWNKTTGTSIRRLLATNSEFNNLTNVSNAGVGVSGQFTAIRRFISEPLYDPQTISGTLKGRIKCFEAAVGDNYTIAVAAKVIQADGTDRGVLLAVSASDDTSATPPEMAITTATNRALRDAAESASLSLSSVNAQTGDRIVVELGFRQASTSVANGTLNFGCSSGDTDLPEDDTSTAINNPWVEFSQDLVFIGFFDIFNIPTDGGTNAIEPVVVIPAGLRAGDLICFVGQERVTTATHTIMETGGQSWKAETAIGIVSNTARLFWCVFNGNLTGNPSINQNASGTNSGFMVVFRPPATDWSWKVNVAQVELDDSTDPFTVTGQTTVGAKPTVTLAGWFSTDDNLWGPPSAGWAAPGMAQYRNTAGTDQSATFAYRVQFAAAATGNVEKSQISLGPDASTTFIITFEADDPIPDLIMQPMLPPYKVP